MQVGAIDFGDRAHFLSKTNRERIAPSKKFELKTLSEGDRPQTSQLLWLF
ncbi:hypothetical protein [Phormidium nigroviride]|nr:hypothetical protein [Oscillatoria nigro-viridis]